MKLARSSGDLALDNEPGVETELDVDEVEDGLLYETLRDEE